MPSPAIGADAVQLDAGREPACSTIYVALDSVANTSVKLERSRDAKVIQPFGALAASGVGLLAIHSPPQPSRACATSRRCGPKAEESTIMRAPLAVSPVRYSLSPPTLRPNGACDAPAAT